MEVKATNSSLLPHPVQGDLNYDFTSDMHNMIMGSLMLVLALAAVLLAFLQWLQGRRHRRRSIYTSTGTQNDVLELRTFR